MKLSQVQQNQNISNALPEKKKFALLRKSIVNNVVCQHKTFWIGHGVKSKLSHKKKKNISQEAAFIHESCCAKYFLA